jgi:hypothetical protein
VAGKQRNFLAARSIGLGLVWLRVMRGFSAHHRCIAAQIQVNNAAGGVLKNEDAVLGLCLSERLGGFCYVRK